MKKEIKMNSLRYLKGILIFVFPPLIMDVMDIILLQFSKELAFDLIKDLFIYSIVGLILTFVYFEYGRKIKSRKTIATIVVVCYYLVFLIQILLALYFSIFVGNFAGY